MYIIVAADERMGIGKNGKLPWHLPKELKYFQEVTTKTEDSDKQNMVLMGRTTWESIPEFARPLKNRKNVVLTRNSDYEADGAELENSIDAGLNHADESIETVYLIGGANLFEQLLDDPRLTGIYLTKIEGDFDCDTFLPEIPKSFGDARLISKDDDLGTHYQYLLYKKN